MLYIHINKNSIEVIATKKGLVGEEKIIGSAKKSVNYDLLDGNLLKDEETFISEILSLFDLGYPEKIKNDNVSLVIPDDGVFHGRFIFEKPFPDLPEKIISEAKKILPDAITSYENFYREESLHDVGVNVIYSAVPIGVIIQYAKVFKRLKMDLKYLTTEFFSVYSLFYPHIISDNRLLFCDFHSRWSNYFMMDKSGPVTFISKKSYVKTLSSELKSIIKKNNIVLTGSDKIIISGDKSLEIELKNEKEEGLNIEKFTDIIETILTKNKLEFESGGVPRLYFDKVVGLIIHSKNQNMPNFASDIKTFSDKEAAKVAKEDKPLQTDEVLVAEEPQAENLPQTAGEEKMEKMVTEEIIEYKKSRIPKLPKVKLIIPLVLIITAAITFFVFKPFSSKTSLLSFFNTATPTPTVTVVPTSTPTPTIDSSLKRSGITLAVQNGTDKSGYAKQTASFLEEKGYTKVTASNADKDSYENTIIKIKESKNVYLQLILSDIKDKFPNSKQEILEESSKFDAIIILGKS